MLIESALVLFIGQLVYVVLYWLDNNGWFVIVLPVTNLYVSLSFELKRMELVTD